MNHAAYGEGRGVAAAVNYCLIYYCHIKQQGNKTTGRVDYSFLPIGMFKIYTLDAIKL